MEILDFQGFGMRQGSCVCNRREGLGFEGVQCRIYEGLQGKNNGEYGEWKQKEVGKNDNLGNIQFLKPFSIFCIQILTAI